MDMLSLFLTTVYATHYSELIQKKELPTFFSCLFSKALPLPLSFSKNCCQAILPMALSPNLRKRKQF